MTLTAWPASSQTAIQKDSVVIAKHIARKVLIDLADYDRLRENKVEANLAKCIEIQKEKDVLINFMSQQNKLMESSLLLTEKQLQVKEEQYKTAKGSSGNGFLYGLGGLAVGLVVGVLLVH